MTLFKNTIENLKIVFTTFYDCVFSSVRHFWWKNEEDLVIFGFILLVIGLIS